MATESNLIVYSITLGSSYGSSLATGSVSITIGSKASTSASATDTGSGNDNLNILGDNNTAGTSGHRDIFNLTMNGATTTAYYFGTATVGGVTGFVANTATDGSGTWYFVAVNNPASSGLKHNNTGTLTYDTTGTRNEWSLTNGTPICFMAGTAIATPDGEVLVENLKPGDFVLTADGSAQSVRWLGRQTVSRLFADPLRVNPIRILQGALGDGLPRRDLLCSPDHAFLLDGILVQAGALVNGVTILRENTAPEMFVYYHVELSSHALILAEGVPAETFIDNIARLAFDNWQEHETLSATPAPLVEMNFPRAKSARQVPQALAARLSALAETAAAA
ncbi:MAG: Hint domain-containing protein [Rhodospirillales bacterium]|nr:Hint domain-containing protein [Rhodospirillales bacterium]